MLLLEVKPIHCQDILNKLTPEYAESTVYQCRITLYVLFEAAVENDILGRNPVKKSVKVPPGKRQKKKGFCQLRNKKSFWMLSTV